MLQKLNFSIPDQYIQQDVTKWTSPLTDFENVWLKSKILNKTVTKTIFKHWYLSVNDFEPLFNIKSFFSKLATKTSTVYQSVTCESKVKQIYHNYPPCSAHPSLLPRLGIWFVCERPHCEKVQVLLWNPLVPHLSPPADSCAFGAQYSCFELLAYFSWATLKQVFDKDYAYPGIVNAGTGNIEQNQEVTLLQETVCLVALHTNFSLSA